MVIVGTTTQSLQTLPSAEIKRRSQPELRARIRPDHRPTRPAGRGVDRKIPPHGDQLCAELCRRDVFAVFAGAVMGMSAVNVGVEPQTPVPRRLSARTKG